MNKLFNKFNKFIKKKNHLKDEAPVDDANDQMYYNSNNNNLSSGSDNNKNKLSSGSSYQTISPNIDDTNNNNNNNSNADRLRAKARSNNNPKSNSQQRRTLPVGQNTGNKSVKKTNIASNNIDINVNSLTEKLTEIDNEVPEKDVLSTFQNSFSERIAINLPLDELNASSLRADVLLSMAKDKAELLDKSVTDTEKKMEEVSSQMKIIINKSRSITQTAAVINAKLINIDDWIDRIGSDKSDFKINIVEFFVSLFSILTTIFSLMWFSFRRQSIKNKNY